MSELSLTSSKPRTFTRDGRMPIEIVGSRAVRIRDLYHFLIGAPWWTVIGAVVVLFLAANVVFAFGYLASDGIAGARPGSFSDAFFFSIQTMGTIGYGTMSPKNFAANILVTLEAIVGLIGLAMATGLMFAKFSRPSARVMFSRVATISTREGIPTLMFRVANERTNHVVEAQIRVALLRDEVTAEGERIRRIYDVHPARGRSPVFALSWTVLHPITPESPLYGATPQSLKEQEVELIVILTGIDETLAQAIHARHSYSADEVLWNVRFVDILSTTANSRRLDYSKFHDVIATAPSKDPALPPSISAR